RRRPGQKGGMTLTGASHHEGAFPAFWSEEPGGPRSLLSRCEETPIWVVALQRPCRPGFHDSPGRRDGGPGRFAALGTGTVGHAARDVVERRVTVGGAYPGTPRTSASG